MLPCETNIAKRVANGEFMPYIYEKVFDLEGKDRVGSHQCVAIVQVYALAPITSKWAEGPDVKGNSSLAIGTAIATFVNGKYPNKSKDNHAGLYMGQDAKGIQIMDQWVSLTRTTIRSRTLPFKGKNPDGSFKDPSDNGDAFSVIY